MSEENNNKKIVIYSILVVIILAMAVGLGGAYLLLKYKDVLVEYDKTVKTTTKTSKTVTTGEKTQTVSTMTETEDNSNMVPYMSAIQTKIKKNWTPPAGIKETQKTTVLFKVDKNGELRSVKILESSKSEEMDKSAIEAVNAAAPFEPLPKGFKGEFVDVNFTFDYNVHKN